jgi:hypothetical protein
VDNQTKQLIGFAVAALAVAAVLLFVSNRGSFRLYPEPVDGQQIPVTKEQVEMSNVSRSLAELLPGFAGLPVGDIAIVPGETGWRAIVFGVSDEKQIEQVRLAIEDFSQKNKDIGPIEVVFDKPPVP